MRSRNDPKLDLKIKDMIQDMYNFNCLLAQCYEPSMTANPAMNCVVKNRRETWGFSSCKFHQVDYWY